MRIETFDKIFFILIILTIVYILFTAILIRASNVEQITLSNIFFFISVGLYIILIFYLLGILSKKKRRNKKR